MRKTKISFLLICSILIIFTAPVFGAQKSAVKNIIVMISDGCGYNQVESAGLYANGKAGGFIFESFPVKCAMSTYSACMGYYPEDIWGSFGFVAVQATDSAAAATAMSTGKKTYDSAICFDVDRRPLENILERAEKRGKATGVITSVQLSHATPAGFLAHNQSRDAYAEIAKEMIEKSPADVIMGCGHPLYDVDGKTLKEDKTPDYRYVGGEDLWKAVLEGREFADADGDGKPDAWFVAQSRDDFKKLMTGDAPKRVLGVAQVFATLQQGRSGDAKAEPFAVPLTETVPTLDEMAAGAINVLDADPDGFVLMIEGGAIDWACHGNQTGRMIEEELAFVKAVETVCQWVEKNSNWNETLLIVTGDHETGYLTGPGSGAKETGPVWNPPVNNGKGKVPGVEWHSGGHTNSLVPFYAKGNKKALGLLTKRANMKDPVRGSYLDNTAIAKIVFELLGE